jgi:Predicted membrane protein (DUF2306)
LKVVSKIAYGIFFLLALALTYNALTYANFDPQYGFLRLKQQAIATGWYLPFYYSHVLISGLILLAGFIQVLPAVRIRWRAFHRGLGKFYVFGIIFFAAPGALIMSLFVGRGEIVLMSFLVQTALWFYFTFQAYRKACEKDFVAHEHWMWRSFALTLAAITLRLYVFIFSYWVNLNSPAAYATIAWMSWAVNLVVAEWWFRRRAKSFRISHP